MTEDQAKTLLCWNKAGHFRPVDPAKTAGEWTNFCAASECIAWQWDAGNPHDSKKGGILLPRSQWPGHCSFVERQK